MLLGDLTWGMDLNQARADFAWINRIPGRKIILKGNHDYWWTTASKFYRFCEENGFQDLYVLHNNCYFYNEYALCGTRGWFFEEERSGQHDEKVFRRELCRLEASLQAAGDRTKLCFLHYPPRYRGYECPEILELLRRYDVRACYYGHLHGISHKLAMEGLWDGVEFRLLAADYLNFRPAKIISEEIQENGIEKSQIKILALLTRLRQICCHPSLFIDNYKGESGKLNQCIEIVKDAIQSGHKILLFSGYTACLLYTSDAADD